MAKIPPPQNLKNAEAIFKKYNPEYPFDYKFVDQELMPRKFENEQQQGTLASIICRAHDIYFLPGFIWSCHLYGRKQDKRNWCT